MTTDPIAIIDGALTFLDGGRRWARRVAWNGRSACLGEALVMQVRGLRAPDTSWAYKVEWEALPEPLLATLRRLLVERCWRCRTLVAAWRVAPEPIAFHNDNHARDYAEIQALLIDAKAALVAEAEPVEAGRGEAVTA